MQPINPEKVRFIKLGKEGGLELRCLNEGIVWLGYESPYHQDCLAGNWSDVRSFWLSARKGNEGAATRDINQIRDFYELKESDVWITFFKKKMYWCRAFSEVIELDDKSRIRRVIGAWSSTDLNGQQLHVENIDGRVTKVQGFRGTICSIDKQDYLVNKINGQAIQEVENARLSFKRLKLDIEDLIEGLWWHDFELLIDLIFSKSGWQRFSVLGKTEKDIDLDVYSPATQKRAFVQIKTTTTSKEVEQYIKIFNEYEQFDEMYFVYHSCKENLSGLESNKIHIWGPEKIAGLVVNAGLAEWLINKRT